MGNIDGHGEGWRFVRAMAVAVALFAAADVGFGVVAERVFMGLPLRDNMASTVLWRSRGGADVVLIGSSRCHHHYVAAQLRDSLSRWLGEEVTVYNYGLDGVYVNSSLCALECMLQEYRPRMVILDANSHEFGKEYTNTVASSSPLYRSNEVVRRYINEADWRNRVKMLSGFYRFRNAMPVRMAQVLMSEGDSLMGYIPVEGVMDEEVEYPAGPTLEEFDADERVAENFRRVARLAKEKGVRMVVVDSPRWRPKDNSEYVRRLCEECGVEFLDWYSTEYFNERPELFFEPAHLNGDGAREFTEKLRIEN